MKNPVRKGKEYVKKVKASFIKAGINVAIVPRSGAGELKGDLWIYLEKELYAVTECKKNEKINIWACLAQAMRQAGSKVGLLVFSRNNEKDYVCLELNDFIAVLQKFEELKKQG